MSKEKKKPMLLYGICSKHDFPTSIGSVFILENLNQSLYLVREGHCDAVRKEAITLISKEEYDIIRNAHNEVLKNIEIFSDDTKEYFQCLYGLRNILKDEDE